MLTCKKCGAIMSGTDLVCKKCGTPWGKSGKSKAPFLVSILLTIIISLGILYITNKELFFELVPVDFYHNITDAKSINTDKQDIPVEKTDVQENKDTTEEIDITSEGPTDINDIDNNITPIEAEIPVTLPPVFTTVKSSSNLPSQGNFKYTAQMLIDNDNSTAWTEGAKGSGINEWVQFIADTDQIVSGIKIFNGYQKNATTYANNGRLKKIAISFANDIVLTYDIPLQNYSESLNGFDIKFDTPITTNYVTVKILDAYKGAYYNDTAVNKIEIY